MFDDNLDELLKLLKEFATSINNSTNALSDNLSCKFEEINTKIYTELESIEVEKYNITKLEMQKLAELEEIENKINILKQEDDDIRSKIDIISSTTDKENNEVITINSSGTTIITKRNVLCQVKESFLTKLFSTSSENKLTEKEDGVIYVDYDGEIFSAIVSYLKVRTYNPHAPLPSFYGHQSDYFYIIMDHLGLTNLYEEHQMSDDSYEESSIALNEGDRTVRIFEETFSQCRPSNMISTLCKGDTKHSEGYITWRFKRKQLSGRFFIGIISESDNSCIGWGFSGSNITIINKDKKPTIFKGCYKISNKETVITLILDIDSDKMSVRFKTFSNVIQIEKDIYGVCMTMNHDINMLWASLTNIKTTTEDDFLW